MTTWLVTRLDCGQTLALGESVLPTIALIEEQVQAYPWTLQQLTDGVAAGYWLFAVADSATPTDWVGYAMVLPALDHAELLNIAVALQYQGKKVGRQLLQSIENHVLEQGMTELWLELAASNQQALNAYLSWGFQTTGKRKNYYQRDAQQGAEDAVLMTKYLMQSPASLPSFAIDKS
jgi:[ribosomal protein S18]-alanine N-acetyltransferase